MRQDYSADGGVRTARMRRCHRCEYWVFRAPDIWHWPHCVYDANNHREVSDEFWGGPVGNCPAGYWKGLEPVDIEAEGREQQEAALAYQRQILKPLVMAALARVADARAKADFLVELVAGGNLPQALAEECAREGGLDLDAS